MDPERRRWSRPLLLFTVLSAAIWVVAQMAARYWIHSHIDQPDHWTLTTLDRPQWDFGVFAEAFRHFHTADFFKTYNHMPFAYPATSAMFFAFFYLLFPHPDYAFYSVSYAIAVVGALWFGAALARRGMRRMWAFLLVGVTLLLSYPFRFEWQRANIEIVLWAIAAIAVMAFWKKLYWVAAVLIGIVTAAKVYPFILLGLLVSRRKYREAVAAVVVAVCVNALSLFLLGPTYSFANRSVGAGLSFFRETYVLVDRNLGYDHSLFALLKCFFYQPGDPTARLAKLLPVYMAAMAVAGLLLYFLRIVRLPRVNQIVTLVVLSVLIPPVSYDYTLMHVYIAWAVMVLYVVETGAATKPVLWMFALFAVVMSPEGPIYFMDLRVAAQMKCVALVGILALALRHRFEEAGDPQIAGA